MTDTGNIEYSKKSSEAADCDRPADTAGDDSWPESEIVNDDFDIEISDDDDFDI